MERFAQEIIAGGLALVAGLWLVTLPEAGSGPWLIGLALSIVGVGGLAGGIWLEVDI